MYVMYNVYYNLKYVKNRQILFFMLDDMRAKK